LQTFDGLCRLISLFLVVPLAKITIDPLIRHMRIGEVPVFPVKELLGNFIRDCYGVWSILALELIRRIFTLGPFVAILSMMLMSTSLLGYVFAMGTGVCLTNTKCYLRGSIGYAFYTWLLLALSFLSGSGWMLQQW
jgi:hypothetical protein